MDNHSSRPTSDCITPAPAPGAEDQIERSDPGDDPGDRGRFRARRDLLLFLVLVTLLSAPFMYAIGRTQALETPAALVRLVTRQPLRSRRAHPRSRMLSSYLLPFAVAVPAYITAISLGLVHVDAPPAAQWTAVIIASIVLNVVFVPGEEFGWRGFMVPRLVRSGLPRPLLLSGVIWGLWHLPLVVWGGLVLDGPSPWVSAVLLTVVCAAIGYVMALLRLASGGAKVPIAFHVTWNVAFQALFEVAVVGDDEGLWLGEAGVLTTITATVVSAWACRASSPLRTSAAKRLELEERENQTVLDRDPRPTTRTM